MRLLFPNGGYSPTGQFDINSRQDSKISYLMELCSNLKKETIRSIKIHSVIISKVCTSFLSLDYLEEGGRMGSET